MLYYILFIVFVALICMAVYMSSVTLDFYAVYKMRKVGLHLPGNYADEEYSMSELKERFIIAMLETISYIISAVCLAYQCY